MAMSVENLPEFPVSSLLPRKETGILSFLNKFPKYDGTGVVIAIFDSGVDPAAQGLQVCSSGAVKVIDRLDGSGAGDVDTSTVSRASDSGTLQGVSGRTLTIPSSWTNPSGDYHLGIKSAYSLYPTKLKDRLVKERKENVFEPHLKKYQEAAMRRLQKEKQRSNPAAGASATCSATPTEDADTSVCEGGPAEDGNSGCCSDDTTPHDCDHTARTGAVNGTQSAANNGCQSSNPGAGGESPACDYSSFLEKQQKEEAEAEVALLAAANKKYHDAGPAYDCVVYNDGVCWRACIDTSECGDLSQGVHLGEYRHTLEWAALTAKDNFTVSINVHNDGNLLEIVGMCSSHGTHVASIASACFPDDPERNGVAPGAQIVSVTIGDNRVHGMETGTALSRAMAWVMDNPHYKVDVINMSYGEHSHFSLYGRLGELASDVVNKYGVLWVASASNHGPALTTVGSPPDFFSDCIMGIGAYISPDMMRAEYSIMDKLPGTAYTWSSRGPTSDGGRGVSVCAPGGAITSMPAFTNKTSQLLNGTSMASPHAAGCVALLLSGLKKQGLRYTPYTVRRAVQNTALLLNIDPFVQGHGLLQVEKAFDYLLEHSAKLPALMPPEDSMRFTVECGGRGLKGIYLRNWTGNKSVDVNVSIEPVQFNDVKADDSEKRRLNLDLVLTCDAPYVSAPDCLHMSYTLRSFMVRVNPLSLERGCVYFTSIKAYVANAPERGPLFEVPITVVMPIVDLDHGYFYRRAPEVYRAGCVRRTFLRVPEGASWAQFTVKSSNTDQNQRITLHAVQLFPQCSVLTYDHYKTFSCLYPEEQSTTSFSVSPGLTLELCVARWWAALHDTSIEFSVTFHGIRPYSENLVIYTNNPIQRMDVCAKLRTEELWPQAVIKHHVLSLSPYENRIEVLGGLRDTVPVSRPIYQLILSYSFSLLKTAEITPRCGLLNEYLYESAVESQLWMVFDSKKQYLGAGDAYSSKYSLKLDKGDYVLRLHVRHEKTELLEKMQEMPVSILTKLAQEVKLEAFSNYYSALTGAKKMGVSIMQAGEITPIFFQLPNLQEKSFKPLGLGPGHILSGHVSFAKDEQARRTDTYPLRIIVTETLASKKRQPACVSDSDGAKKEPRTMQDYSDALRDLQLTWITKLDNESSEKLYNEAMEQHSSHIPLHVSRIMAVDSHYNGASANGCCCYMAMDGEEEGAPAIAPAKVDSPGEEAGDSSSGSLVVVEASEHARDREDWHRWRAAVTELAAKVQKHVDLPAVLAHLGTKTDTRADAAKFKTQMDRQKNALMDALNKLGMATAFPYVPSLINPFSAPAPHAASVPRPPPDALLSEMDALATTLLKITEPSDVKVISFFVSYYQVRRLYATAARLVQRALDDVTAAKYQRDAVLRLATLYHLLGYHQLVDDIVRTLPLRFPDKYCPF